MLLVVSLLGMCFPTGIWITMLGYETAGLALLFVGWSVVQGVIFGIAERLRRSESNDRAGSVHSNHGL